MRALFSALNAEDALLVKRAKNRKPRSIPKNADPVEYKWATALEALMGYYYLAGEKEKLSRLIEDTMAVIDGEYLA
jgi:ribonuclease-3 family protein